jgi:predicted DCC family thiol-disulfide oxidoreductase YuxK
MVKSFSNFILMATQSIILFDGVCNLCNEAVQFVIKRDKKNQFLFASLQSVEGKKILMENSLLPDKLYSFILAEDGKIYDRSTAALRVVKKLSGFWHFFYGFIIVPEFIRNGFITSSRRIGINGLEEKMNAWFLLLN